MFDNFTGLSHDKVKKNHFNAKMWWWFLWCSTAGKCVCLITKTGHQVVSKRLHLPKSTTDCFFLHSPQYMLDRHAHSHTPYASVCSHHTVYDLIFAQLKISWISRILNHPQNVFNKIFDTWACAAVYSESTKFIQLIFLKQQSAKI